jgi:hypothetical protein
MQEQESDALRWLFVTALVGAPPHLRLAQESERVHRREQFRYSQWRSRRQARWAGSVILRRTGNEMRRVRARLGIPLEKEDLRLR